MDKVDIILWVLSGGFGLMLVMWHNLNSRIEQSEKGLSNRIDQVEKGLGVRIDGLSIRIDKLDEKLTDVDRRLCRLEGAFSSKDCCMIKEDRNLRQAE